MFNFVDLCCGIGAFHLALTKLGGKCVLASDLDPQVKLTYETNYGTDQKWVDNIYDIKSLPKHDVLCAGFPCQPFSSAGKRQGRADDSGRGTVVYQIMKLIKGCKSRPKLVILENVYGILHTDDGVVAAYVRRKLAQLGYVVQVLLIDAIDMGSPMNRKRVFFVGTQKPLEGEPVSRKKPLVIGDILEKDAVRWWAKREKYVLIPKSKWTVSDDGKVFVGYFIRPYIRFNNPLLPSAHTQGSRIFHVNGGIETFTSTHNYFVFMPGKGVTYLTTREMYNCMGFPKSFKIHNVRQKAKRQVSNSINLFALQPVVDWAVKGVNLSS